MEATKAVGDLTFLPSWLHKLPYNMQVVIAFLVIVHIIGVIGVVVYYQYSIKSHKGFKGKLT
jgi:hypothetical protein